MKRRILLYLLVCSLCLLGSIGKIARAQETPVATAEPPIEVTITDETTTLEQVPVGDVTITDGGGAIINTDTPSPLAPLLALGSTVFALMEMIKTAGLSKLLDSIFYHDAMDDEEIIAAERSKSFVLWLIASLVGLAVLLITESTLDVLGIFGYAPASTSAGQVARLILTAAAIAAPNALLHALYDLLRKNGQTV